MSNDGNDFDDVEAVSSHGETESDAGANGSEAQSNESQTSDPTLTERVLDFVDRYRRMAYESPSRAIPS